MLAMRAIAMVMRVIFWVRLCMIAGESIIIAYQTYRPLRHRLHGGYPMASMACTEMIIVIAIAIIMYGILFIFFYSIKIKKCFAFYK